MSLIQRKLSQTHFGISYSHMIRSKNRFPLFGIMRYAVMPPSIATSAPVM